MSAAARPPGGSAHRVADLLALARGQGVDRLDAQLLLARRLGVSRAWLIAHDDAGVPADAAQACRADLAARADGQPVAYLVGEREFHGLKLHVTPAVLVPRPDTEVLVDWAIDCLRGPLAARRTPRVVDLGTGSGAIALAVAQACPHAEVCGVDRSAAALDVARANGYRLGSTVEWLQGDWFEPLAGRRFDLVLSNPPYIDADDPHLHALHAEPLEALSPGPDGLAALSRIAAQAPAHLQRQGWLLLEHGHQQGDAVQTLLREAGGHDVSTRRDLAGHPRCTGARWEG
jgi:release factor glutamine methyltransferase